MDPLTRGTMDLSITDRPATPYHRANPPSSTLDEANPNPNGSCSGSPPRLSPLGNQIIHHSTGRQPPRRLHRRASFRLNGAVSLIPPLGTRKWGGVGDGEDGRSLDEATGTVTMVGGLGGCVDPAATGPYGGSRVEKRRRKQGGETEDRLGHRRKRSGKRSVC
jgi:hypothetical protein